MAEILGVGRLIYKCRRCEKEIDNLSVPNLLLALTHLTAGVPLPPEWGGAAVEMTSIHFCDEKTLGITDLIGGRATD